MPLEARSSGISAKLGSRWHLGRYYGGGRISVHGKEAVHVKANGGSHGRYPFDRARGPSAKFRSSGSSPGDLQRDW
ncbi:bsr7662 [Bradyrhizobium diazoefficiens USDA 110]|uniref:Bsr7662 protein n=1 Tax=Bradyrhizobium diazoefficiens (strain JCM 10833 / BCRC 13528 / IAM 13628 / NBRC 14792 / USDA 110) TaxID=224911 RepID=Q89CY3_BRADU|nr:hypothetical protein CO678_35915 [Bradyrhizobium diazoefficiens]QBP26400.1 hypothetical protein Bdiaspc4_40460 [Bradyrhizobium diazoefficiens]BAC52927.1 bsr7662 [Bradyrhizobium diazoefficiens USDA 110]